MNVENNGSPAVINQFVSGNDFTKIFKLGEIDLYVTKAFDEDSNAHFLICMTPEIAEVNALEIKYPIHYATEADRDYGFETFDLDFAVGFMDALIKEIKSNDEKKKSGTFSTP